MNVQREDHGEAVLLIVEGQVDMHTSPDLRKHFIQGIKGRRSPIVVDLSEVSFIDSSGLATLIEALRSISGYGGKLRLVGLNPAVENVFRLSHLSSIFEIYDTRAEALS